MKKILFTVAGLLVALAVACSGGATSQPTGGATVTSPATTVPKIETPTQRPVQEWRFDGVSVEGNTVTVSLFYHSTTTVSVTLNGAPETRRDNNVPVLAYIFEGVPVGEHDIVIKDVMGNVETTSVLVTAPQPAEDQLPDWLAKWLAELDAGEVEFPPQSVTRYESQGETVYYVVHQCCDQFSDLLDAGGKLIGHPDGGITGKGDGVTKFSPFELEGEEVWASP